MRTNIFNSLAITLVLLASALSQAEAAPNVTLVRVVLRPPAGQVWGSIENGPFCIPVKSERGTGAPIEVPVSSYLPAFRQGFFDGGAPGGTLDLFEGTKNSSAADFQVGAIVVDLHVKICMQGILGVKNEAVMAVEWQIYSNEKGAVVATVKTSADSKFKSTAIDLQEVARQAFVENSKQLAALPEVNKLLASDLSSGATETKTIELSRLSLTGSSLVARPVGDAVGSVVLVSLGDGFGSGVLVSADGYILTNEHVVGRTKSVRIRWSDGFETTGEVVRTHVRRDVALIKSDPHGREPLPLRLTSISTGDTVLAIGAPEDQALQGTVTVVSFPRLTGCSMAIASSRATSA